MTRTAPLSPSLALTLAALLGGCASTGSRSDQPWSQEELGHFHRTVTTDSAEAQRWFDQGLVLCYGFDHEVATAAFQRAAELDPRCAMAYWGIAFAAGPNINNPGMDEARSRAAHEAAQKALSLSEGASPVERDLIAAVAKRYAWPEPEDRKALDVAFADAMREAARKHPDDLDVATLFAESLMDLRPWDLWTPEGEMRPETPEVLDTLARVLERDPRHPGALHYTVHAWEASPTPERALPAANTLRDRVPGSSHLVHMPGHIDLRLGRYPEAMLANQRAIEADKVRVERVGAGGFYTMYRAHNYHFLMWAAMFDGQSEIALRAGRETVEQIPLDVVRELPQFIEGFLAAPYHALVRFGRWNEILREPEPSADLPGTRAFWRYARGVAYASLGDTDASAREVVAFERALEAVPEDYLIGNNTTRAVLAVAREVLHGEHEYRLGHHDLAFQHLREAAKLDDALHYDEPWGWLQPARHALGALLLEQGHVDEAAEVYRDDLKRFPNNGWSLHGLAECQRRQGRTAEARATDAKFREAWKRSDIPLRASCFCRTVFEQG